VPTGCQHIFCYPELRALVYRSMTASNQHLKSNIAIDLVAKADALGRQANHIQAASTHRRCRLRSCRASASAAAAISSLLPVVAAAAAGLGCLAVAVDSRRASREACAGVKIISRGKTVAMLLDPSNLKGVAKTPYQRHAAAASMRCHALG